MMVTFVSQCEKKALSRTRRVLDAFANRIGDNTWQTVITEDGLIAVKTLLRKTATKNTAVACHWLRSRSRSELVWIVGNRRRFNAEGIVPVNSTHKNLMNSRYENNWTYLPLIKALAALAALLHDWGKATALFQNKLKKHTKQGDPLRHEWISCLLLNALVQQSGNSDAGWLKLLIDGNIDEQALKASVVNQSKNPLADLPPVAQLVGWLIMTHHRLPSRNDPKQECDQKRESLPRIFKSIDANWGYQNGINDADYQDRLKACFEFPEGLLSQSAPWLKQIKKWSAKLLQAQAQIQQLLENGAYRLLLHHARLCLMLGDHYYSSCAADPSWNSAITLYANTDKQELKQKLDEHLVHVSDHALKISQTLSRFTSEMETAYDIKSLKQKSPKGFEWQDKAVENLSRFKKQHEPFNDKGYGWFIVNMASTGCGKTIANAKIMRALSDDGESLRYILALGLRTLTLQTGDEYRDRIGLKSDELAVLIGSSAVKELHEKAKQTDEQPSYEDSGSESLEILLDEDLDYANAPIADFLDAVIPKYNPKLADKHKAFLYKPVLACTIDHIIAATETTRGGKYILPCLRLLSSDLVIDEVDDFDGKDLIAIGRLIHLAGMLGRKVMISSATIPPALAEGFFNAYQEGWSLHSHFKQAHQHIACAWIDEFGSLVQSLDKNDSLARCRQYQTVHRQFIGKRVGNLHKQVIRRKAYIVPCDDLFSDAARQESVRQQYFDRIKQTASRLHQQHHTVDGGTGKKVSFGLVRMANIPPCIELSQYLLQTDWDADFTPKIMAYHSRQVLLLRHEQEQHLDQVLKRKEQPGEMPAAFSNPIIRKHLDTTDTSHVLFILVATPVEEVGRDHDFDWAIVEPSSYRSIIQLSGRVRRHRQAGVEQPNIAVMQYNLKALRKDGKPAYCRPGYENLKSLKLTSHDLTQLVDETVLKAGINAAPRIQQPETLRPKQQLVDLEHQAMHNSLTQYSEKGPQCLQAWLTECWWLTALPQQLNRFRDGSPDITLYLVWQDDKAVFCEKTERGEFIPFGERQNIKIAPPLTDEVKSKLWLERDYEVALRRLLDSDAEESSEEGVMRKKSKRYGEVIFLENKNQGFFYSDQFGLFPRKG
ncbi:type I-F CRISPR-associated helicase Cas3f [Candidatus Methylobacter oryzae]|uniref:Type I-F CRISPR-associated helicase Cas3 n=1 Tax=Candidatus Methylobacter oryzae TaxID=2497749 RepID=A0ABY3CDA2_9GAMM|nr:type I-F CRISPR-associated helicase Cas3f [Candidatus Methylobacter oryzae]TRW97112.1 type I-F CRISPR-associated helicase Cas3 [Candidatus Methylobacter oryzae]